MWRVWKKTGTSIREIYYEWTYEMVEKANAFLDMEDAANITWEYIQEKENPGPDKGRRKR